MPDNNKKIIPINYTNREFSTIRDDLMQIAERFYPDNFRDFSEASFGSMMLDAVAYVGDQLSFYLDYNVNESFLDTAYSITNVVRHGRVLGYKNPGRPSTFGEVALFLEVPAESSGLGPDTDYTPILNRGTRFTSQNGLSYVLTENIDFNNPKNPIVVSKVNTSTGSPTHFAIKAYANVVSGLFGTKEYTIGGYRKFLSIPLQIDNLSEIISVIDSEGNKYYEVDYLSQDIVYQEITNKNYKSDNVPSILKPLLVSRKFVLINNEGSAVLQFGSGDSSQNDIIAQPQNVAMDIFGKNYISDLTFDPTKLSKNKNYGIVPQNTTLTIAYRVTNPTNSNAAVGSINSVAGSIFNFKNLTLLSASKVTNVQASLEVINETPIVGNTSYASTAEIKARIYDTFPTQNRAVTQADYENLIYRMPGKFGSIKKCSVQKDPDSLKRNLNAYVISEDNFGKLIQTNSTIKNNLKTWLNHYRMVNDTIDVLDPYIINLGITFSINVVGSADKQQVLNQCIRRLVVKYSEGFFIGEHFSISGIYSELKKEQDVLDVTRVKLVNKSGARYSNINFVINSNLSPDGDQVLCPKNAIFEIKFPTADIKGKTR